MSALAGGCFCGRLRYRIDAPPQASVNCHCTMCRRTSAAPFVTWLIVDKNAFHYTRGKPTTLASSATGTRYFCAECGTPVVCINSAHPEWVDVTVGSLDDPNAFPPTKDFYEDTRLSWLPHG